MAPWWWPGKRRREQVQEAMARKTAIFRAKYANFRDLLESNAELLEIIGDMQVMEAGGRLFGQTQLEALASRAAFHLVRLAGAYDRLSAGRHPLLLQKAQDLAGRLSAWGKAEVYPGDGPGPLVLDLDQVDLRDRLVVGGKAAALGDLRRRGLPAPEGLVVTVRGFRMVLAQGDLEPEIRRRLLAVDPRHPGDLLEAAQEIQRLFLEASLPAELAEELDRAAGARWPDPATALALRSSAVGEDGELSYAGQYRSLLGVTRAQLGRSYMMILASLFTPRALAYRLHRGVSYRHTPMAVAVLPLVPAVAAGVAYSRDPLDPADQRVLVSGVWGLGGQVVDGAAPTDRFRLERGRPPRLAESLVAPKERRQVLEPGGGVVWETVEEDRRQAPCLDPERLERIAAWALELEEAQGQAQDLEWALGPDGRLVLLQARPLRVGQLAAPAGGPRPVAQEPLLSGGETAAGGAGAGPVFWARNEQDLARFPAGGVLCAPRASARLSVALPLASAVLAEAGGVSGHLAAVAREFRVPALFNLPGLQKALAPGQVCTVDADGRRVFAGRVEELLSTPRFQPTTPAHSPARRALAQLAALVTPLNLTDPRSPEFSPRACQTVHDVMRFAHEHCYQEMFHISDLAADAHQLAYRLAATVPLDLYIIDLGGGVSPSARGNRVHPKEITSAPLAVLLEGMLHPALHETGPRPVHMGGLLSVMSQQMLNPPKLGAERFGDKSYAIVSDTYLNFSSRVGYHYSILDVYLGLTINKNYLHFEFKGGAADDERRGRRAQAITAILEALDFHTETKADLVKASFDKAPPAETAKRLDQLGRLLIFTRQMDMLMSTPAQMEAAVAGFLAGRYQWWEPS